MFIWTSWGCKTAISPHEALESNTFSKSQVELCEADWTPVELI